MISSGKIPKRNILGIPVAALRLKDISSIFIKLIETSGKKTFFYVNAHCLNVARKDPVYKKILQNATLVYADGMGPILASKMLDRKLPERTSAPDFIEEVFAVAEAKRWILYFLGNEDNTLRKAVRNIKKRFPMLTIKCHNGFFKNNDEIVEDINRAKPDILLVGMGTPRQEKWIADNINAINAKTFWAVGGLFDFLSGKRNRAPRWIQRLGFEWAFRLYQEPRRLWKRYVFGNIVFILTVLRERALSFRKSNR